MYESGVHLSVLHCLLERLEREIHAHRRTGPSAHDPPGEHVDHEGDVHDLAPLRQVGEVRHAQLMGRLPGSPARPDRELVVRLERGMHQHRPCRPFAKQAGRFHTSVNPVESQGPKHDFAAQRFSDWFS